MSYQLIMRAYCGMQTRHIEDASLECCRAMAAWLIRRHRTSFEYPVTILERGYKWELESDPEGASMIGDDEGVLAIVANEESEEADESEPWDG